MQQLQDLAIYYLSEQAVTVEFGNLISEDVLLKVSSFNAQINEQPFPGFRTSVPAYATVNLFYDPVQVAKSALRGSDCFEKVSNYLLELKDQPLTHHDKSDHLITIPVCYGGTFGPDLQELAALHNLTTEKVIELHTQATYKVYMIGFVPGFAYLGGMSKLLETPRKATPRKAVSAGSVGIAGEQTGIYPLQTPGGWQIIGKTPLILFSPHREQPSLLKSGDGIIFKPIDENEFEYLASKPHADSN